MADTDLLPSRGVPYRALVDANGIAIGGTSTTALLASKGMKAICQVDPTGVALSDGATSVALLASRGIRAFAAVDENGVSVDDATTKADVIRSRGIRPMVAVDANGLSQTGPATIPVIAQRGLSYFCPVDETGTAGSLIPVPPNTIRARPGIFTLTGETMTPVVGYAMVAGFGAFALAGQSANLVPPSSGTDVATTAWVSAVTGAGGTVSTTQQGYVDTLIKGLKTDGLFAIMDRIWLLASENQKQATYDIIHVSPWTQTGTGTFTTGGYTGSGSSYLDTGFVTSTAGGNFAANSASFGTYIRNSRNGSTGSFTAMANDISGAGSCRWLPQDGDTTSNILINDSSFTDFPTTNAQGFYGASRTGASAVAVYRNASGTAVFTGTAPSTGLSAQSFFIAGARAGAGTGDFSQDQISIAFLGGGLSSAQWVSFQARINAYMTSNGINVY